ncbi:hypothetical protein ACF090_11705 [Streptomyces sp. NPDC014892]|uniref:hypothetical protein n=1 Tax=Streptomyces sp. NPDC014892 TaxID=3364930 RepID=UPI00370230BF
MKATRRAPLSEDERLDALGRLLTDTEIPRPLRVVGVIVLLYAQPLTRMSGSPSMTCSATETPYCYGSANRPHPSPHRHSSVVWPGWGQDAVQMPKSRQAVRSTGLEA